MSRIQQQNMYPTSGKLTGIYRGVVENNDDSTHPDKTKRGRCQIRIFGLHTQQKDANDVVGIPTEMLPWAEPALSLFGGSITGVGLWTIPKQGSHVYIFFENGNIMQPRYFATSPGIPTKEADPNKGFNDPDGMYPLSELLNEPDWDRIARDVVDDTIVSVKEDNRDKNVQTADGKTWDEPAPFYKETDKHYPNNIVFATSNDVVMELDDTDDYPRLHLYHPSKSFIEFNKDGHVVFRNTGNRFEIIGKGDSVQPSEHNVHIIGKQNVTIDKDATRLVKGAETEVITKEKKSIVTENETKLVKGNQTTYAEGDASHSAQGKQKIASSGGQTMSTRGMQSISCMGNQTISTKGASTESTMGWRRKSIFGMETKGGVSPSFDQCETHKHVGGRVRTDLGPSPTGKVLNATQGAVSGITGAINDAMSPIMNALNAIQSTINDAITEVITSVNDFVEPITSIVDDVTTIVNQVQSEINNMIQVFNTVTTAPFVVMSTLSNYANKMISFPGQLMQSVVSRMTALPSTLNLMRSLTALYASGMGVQGTVMSMPQRIQNLSTLYSNLQQYVPNLGSMPNSGLIVFSGSGSTATFTTQPYYLEITDCANEGPVNTAQLTGLGTAADEVNQMMQFAQTALANACYDPNGNFQMDVAIDKAFEGYEAALITKITKIATPNDLANSASAMYCGVSMFDEETLKLTNYTMLNPFVLTYLTEDQADMTVYTLLHPPQHPIPGNIWVPDFVLDADAVASLQDTINTYITLYAHAYAEKIKSQIKESFEILINFETTMSQALSGIDLNNATWEGKEEEWQQFMQTIEIPEI